MFIFVMQILKVQFQVLLQVGYYIFVMYVVCDSYVGLDIKMEVMLIVEEVSKVVEMEQVVEDEISELEEGMLQFIVLEVFDVNVKIDFLVGIMYVVKGGVLLKFKKKVVKESDEEDSDEESGMDEESDDISDMNMDMEEEDNQVFDFFVEVVGCVLLIIIYLFFEWNCLMMSE